MERKLLDPQNFVFPDFDLYCFVDLTPNLAIRFLKFLHSVPRSSRATVGELLHAMCLFQVGAPYIPAHHFAS